MAHSHGGGGSHGGFSSSGGRGGSSTPRYSHTYFSGATRYYYIDARGTEREFYAAEAPRKSSVAFSLLYTVFFLALILCFVLAELGSILPFRLASWECHASGDYLSDNYGIIEDEAAWNAAMQDFYQTTGIEPHLYTLHKKDFPQEYYGALSKYTLEDFAYDKYYDLFDDEGHYLLVFAELENGHYIWLDMAGEDTLRLIDDRAFARFQQDMDERLARNPNRGDAILASLAAMSGYVFEISIEEVPPTLLTLVILTLFSTVFIKKTVKTIKQELIVNGYCLAPDDQKGFDPAPPSTSMD